ncbi:hypothetical protein [Robertkochia sediminum]|uniref:hypothetical protein n=1 Tax=Robertkochia sediminum TaxID=2785326 RepID=UPI0019316E30|nr:hypothetical protein [Robertkochia sediminum]MBL7471398.1 hypothetical protein [Robertkochia sediminum]
MTPFISINLLNKGSLKPLRAAYVFLRPWMQSLPDEVHVLKDLKPVLIDLWGIKDTSGTDFGEVKGGLFFFNVKGRPVSVDPLRLLDFNLVEKEIRYLLMLPSSFTFPAEGEGEPLLEIPLTREQSHIRANERFRIIDPEKDIPYLVDVYNEEISLKSWTSTRGIHLRKLIETLLETGYDCSAFIGRNYMRFDSPVAIDYEQKVIAPIVQK